MKTKNKENKIVYQFDIQKADACRLFRLGKYGKFQTPDSDGGKLEKVIGDIKDKERVIITITVDKTKEYAEYLTFKDTWKQSSCSVEDVKRFTKGSITDEYRYFASGRLTYRIKR